MAKKMSRSQVEGLAMGTAKAAKHWKDKLDRMKGEHKTPTKKKTKKEK